MGKKDRIKFEMAVSRLPAGIRERFEEMEGVLIGDVGLDPDCLTFTRIIRKLTDIADSILKEIGGNQ